MPTNVTSAPGREAGASGFFHNELLNQTLLLAEGGVALITSFISAGLFDRFTSYIAPILIGRRISLLGCLGVKSPLEALSFANISWRRIGDQQVFEGTRAEWLDEVRKVVQEKREEG